MNRTLASVIFLEMVLQQQPKPPPRGAPFFDERIRYWRRGEDLQNFGDYLAEFLVDRMLLGPRVESDAYRLVGSSIAGWQIESDLLAVGRSEAGKVSFWGCGLRDEQPLSPEAYQRAAFYGVRGPLTRDALGLPHDTPLGDPGLLLPLAYRQRTQRRPSGRTLCMPHINEDAGEAKMLARTGADEILPSTIPPDLEALERLLDRIIDSEFLLTGSLHGAIVAAAYGTPFAFLESGHLDLPFKWRDFAASLNIPALFTRTVEEGRVAYAQMIAPVVRLPPTSPMLAVCPFGVRPEILIEALRRDGVLEEGVATAAYTAVVQRFSDPKTLAQFQRQTEQHQWEHEADLAIGVAEREASADRLNELEAALARETGDAEHLAQELRQAGIDAEQAASALVAEKENWNNEAKRFATMLAAREAEIAMVSADLEMAMQGIAKEKSTLETVRGQLRQHKRALTGFAEESEERIKTEQLARGLVAGDLEDVWRRVAHMAPGGPRRDHAPLTRTDPEERTSIEWRIAADLTVAPNDLGLYDLRPDDAVPLESAKGADFLERHHLLTNKPDFAGARAYLAQASRGSVVAQDQNPRVSVVIPVFGQLAYTLNCLDSLLAHASRFSFEIIVADDCSPDETEEILSGLSSIVYYKQQKNLGFIGNCNTAAGAARGEFIVLLNSDTRAVEGWLDELIGSFEILERVGVVGSKLFSADNSLQEAGGIVWQDGSAWNYGRDDDPNRPRYCYARRVDYVSGASIALRTAIWNELGGFDERYKPAYCEDSDLFFRVRQIGLDGWMQPLSRIIHYEGKTSGTDVTHGVKAYQVANALKLRERWADVLALHGQAGREPWLERDRYVSGRALVIDATTPTPDQDAGSVTTVKVIGVLQTLGYQVTFIPAHNYLFQARYTQPLQRTGVECLYAPYVSGLEDHLSRHGADYDVVHIFRPNVMEEVADLVDRYAPGAKVIFNNMDLHYLRLERQAGVENSDTLRQIAEEAKPRELQIMARADVVCVPSSVEKRILEDEDLPRPVRVMPYMVDLIGGGPPWEMRHDLVFLGGFGHAPNIDAAIWLAKEIWPSVASAVPDARLLIVGANPPPEVKALAKDRVIVTGRIDDLRPVFDDARIMLAPLRYGAGVKGKIYTALAHGVPVVTTPIGVEGMEVEDGLFSFSAEDAQTLAELSVKLHTDPVLWRSMSASGLDFIQKSHTIPAGVAVMKAAIDLAKPGPRRPSSSDIQSAYALFLHRAPSSTERADALSGDSRTLLRSLAGSLEFEALLAQPIEQNLPVDPVIFSGRPSSALRDWASHFVPLSSPTRAAVAASLTWLDLIYRITADIEFRSIVLTGGERVAGGLFLAGLAHRAASGTPIRVEDLDEVKELVSKARQAAEAAADAWSSADQLNAELATMRQSTSWRVTRPLRSIAFRLNARRPKPRI